MSKQHDIVTKQYFDEVIENIQKKLSKLDKLSEQMDWLIGTYKGHDEEHTLINGRLSENSDRLEIIEEKLSISI